MRINTNISALNAWKNLSITDTLMGKSLEKLSSGFRINRAADDAAGLAISEKMKAQISGLRQGSRNAQDGISLIQTAEGALNETHSILQRMRELATQAASTAVSESDRAQIQAELDELTGEIDRIADSTKFNGISLLNGTEMKILIGTAATTGTEGGSTWPSQALLTELVGYVQGSTFTAAENLVFVESEIIAGLNSQLFGGEQIVTGVTETDPETWSITLKLGSKTVTAENAVNYGGAPDSGLVVSGAGDMPDITKPADAPGPSADGTDQFTIKIGAMNKDALLGSAIAVTGADGQEKASLAVSTIDSAIEEVSSQRATLGAYQNRLEHTINNLNTAAENLAAAESRIRDVDMALEMATFTRHQILLHAGTAMLAQSNMKPQSVLRLLG